LVRRLRTQGAEKLNKEINAGLTNSKIKARLVDVGGTALSGCPRHSTRHKTNNALPPT
jgi:hypothetical protein